MKKHRFLLFGLMVVGLILYMSCRKTESIEENELQNQLTAKFFNSHPPTDPLVISIVNLLKRENTKHNLVEKISYKIGFPYWDKAKTIQKSIARGGEADTSITMIPFSRPSENYINALLLFRTSATDTAYQFLCDWQYSEYGFDTAQAKWDARNIFHIFSEFEKSVFDHSTFVITDPRIFGDSTVEYLKIELDTSNQLSGGRPTILSPVSICTPYRECQPCYARPTSLNGDEMCCYPEYGTVCTTFWVDDGWTPVSGGQGFPPSGGGHDGYDPPESPCGRPTGRPTVFDPCTGGWYPIPLPGEVPPSPDPIDSLLARYSRALKDTAIYIYDNLSQPNAIEHALTGVKQNGQFKILDRRTNNDSLGVIPNFFMGDPSITPLFVWHSHVSLSNNLADRGSFSPADIEMLRNPRALTQDFISFADCRNKRYALVISDVAKAKLFFKNNTFQDIVYAYSPSISGNTQQMQESAIINVIGSLSANGIGFYVSTDSPNFQSWTLLN